MTTGKGNLGCLGSDVNRAHTERERQSPQTMSKNDNCPPLPKLRRARLEGGNILQTVVSPSTIAESEDPAYREKIMVKPHG
jgi:hypothetical protein